MYKLISEEAESRIYKSEITGTEVETFLLKTVPETGEKWWSFRDLLNVPFIRKKASEQITRLYGLGFSDEDFDTFISNHKKTLKSNDPEKYEKAYAELLEFEELKKQTDPVKQSLGLCSVYILSDNERIDTFSNKETSNKIEQWALQPDLQSFFLNFITDCMNNYSKSYNELSQIASGLK